MIPSPAPSFNEGSAISLRSMVSAAGAARLVDRRCALIAFGPTCSNIDKGSDAAVGPIVVHFRHLSAMFATICDNFLLIPT